MNTNPHHPHSEVSHHTHPASVVEEVEKVSTQKKWIIAGLVLLAIIAGGLQWRTFSLSSEKEILQERIKEKNKYLAEQTQNQKDSKGLSASDILLRAQNYRIEWSGVVDEIFRIETANSKIKFENFNSDKEKNISISGIAANHEAVANLIENIKKNTSTTGPFVSNISGDSSPYQFQITFQIVDSQTPSVQ